MVLGVITAIGFAVAFMCALHHWLRAEDKGLTNEEPQMKPQAKAQSQGAA